MKIPQYIFKQKHTIYSTSSEFLPEPLSKKKKKKVCDNMNPLRRAKNKSNTKV